MKILVDHGSSHNLGDTAMIEGAVRLLLDRLPEAEAHVIDRQSLRTGLWDWDRVQRGPSLQASKPSLDCADLGLQHGLPYRLPGVRWLAYRVFNPLGAPAWANRLWADRCFTALGRGLTPDRVRFRNGTEDRSLAEWAEPYDAYFVVGGGNLTDTFPPEAWQRLGLMHAFADRGRPVVLGGQQIGPFRSRAVADAVGRALGRAEFVGLREPTDSVAFCQRAGLDPRRFAVVGDDSFGLEPVPTAEAMAWAGLDLETGGFLAVNVRIAEYGGSRAGHLDEVAALVRELAGRYRLPVVVVPIALNALDSDVESGRRLAERLNGVDVRVVDRPGLTPSLVKGILGGAFAAVGVSYHFCTFALGHGIPTACIYHGDYYEQKARGLAAFWGDERIAQGLGQDGQPDLATRVAALIDDRVAQERLAERAPRLASSWRDALGDALEQALDLRGRRQPASPVA